ncbi:MAG TPA: hypothetical protein VIH35_04720 [Kiritimatiellia bacterium]|jgi:hypothetical protein
MNKYALLAVTALVVLAAGCNTPKSRIQKNPDLFASFPPEVQANIEQGKIDIGYTHDMVDMALGEANRKYTRKSATGSAEVWSYVGYYTTTDRQRVQADVRVRDSTGVTRTVNDWFWVDVQQRSEYEKLRVEFEGDKVLAIETLER